MLTKEQANTAEQSLLQSRKQQSRWSLFLSNTSAPVQNRAGRGMLLGMSAGTIVSVLIDGQAMPGMGFGMLAGSLIGAYFDKQIRLSFLVPTLLVVSGLFLWYLARAFA